MTRTAENTQEKVHIVAPDESHNTRSPAFRADAAIERSTTTILRIGFGIGLLSCVTSLGPPLLAHAPASTLVIGALWCLPWLAGFLVPVRVSRLTLPQWGLVVASSMILLSISIAATGGFDSYLKTSTNWLPWIASVVFAARVVILTAFAISGTLAVTFAASSNLGDLTSSQNAYTVATDLLNPFLVALIALALAGVFRTTFAQVAFSVEQFRSGDWQSSGLILDEAPMRQLLKSSDGGPTAQQPTAHEPLTISEVEIVDQLAAGLTPQQIALQSRREVSTVYEHISNAKSKVGARTISHLVALTRSHT